MPFFVQIIFFACIGNPSGFLIAVLIQINPFISDLIPATHFRDTVMACDRSCICNSHRFDLGIASIIFQTVRRIVHKSMLYDHGRDLPLSSIIDNAKSFPLQIAEILHSDR